MTTALKITHKGQDYFCAIPKHKNVHDFINLISEGEYCVRLYLQEKTFNTCYPGYTADKALYLNGKYSKEQLIIRNAHLELVEVSFYKEHSLRWHEWVSGSKLRAGLMKKKLYKKVHINGDTAALFWHLDEGSLKGSAAFGTEYYPLDNLPDLIARYVNEETPVK